MFNIYFQDRTDAESDLIYICSCKNKKDAQYITDTLKYRDTGGRMDDSGLYEYYIKEEL